MLLDRDPGTIEPGTLYTLDEAKRRTGWSTHAFRTARRLGLRVMYCQGRAYVFGRELIRHIEENGKDSKDG